MGDCYAPFSRTQMTTARKVIARNVNDEAISKNKPIDSNYLCYTII